MKKTACLLVLLVLGAACNKPEFIEMEPREFNFKRRGEKVWARIIAKNAKGHTFPGVKAVWRSSDPKVVTVDEVGHVESAGPGHATIIAKSGDMEAEGPVEVITVEKVVVEPAKLDLTMEGSKTILVKVFDNEGRELKDRKAMSKCADEKVCTAAENVIFPSNPGQTVLTVSVEQQKFDVPVTVVEGPKPKKQ